MVEPTTQPKVKVPSEELQFGHTFTDHMLVCNWTERAGWDVPRIVPYSHLSIPPSASVLHYAIECFEGLKAYKDRQGTIRLFRPHMNMQRLLTSAERLALPIFDPDELLGLLKRLLKIDESWIPSGPGYSLYIRPTIIGTQESLGVAPPRSAMLFIICSPVGPYYRTGFNAVNLYAEDKFVRAWPGGTGAFKLGA